jgi:catechol 2,3-dioxygenase-like lactoylglutathione lyase family enzyme
MHWRLHHVAIPVRNVRKTAEFYKALFDMEETPFPMASGGGSFRDTKDVVALFDDGNDGAQLHLNLATPELTWENPELHVHPVLNGHYAIEVDDIEEVKERLRSKKVHFDDRGQWAYAGYHQVYLYDPEMNVFEVNQRIT